MKSISATMRICLGLCMVTVSVLMAAESLGILPNRQAAIADGRIRLCEAIAIHSSLWASSGKQREMEAGLKAIAQRNNDIVCAEILDSGGGKLAFWSRAEAAGGKTNLDSLDKMEVPIFAGSKQWGIVKIAFQPLHEPGWLGLWSHPLVQLTAFCAALCFMFQFVFLRRTLSYLDPSKVVPSRVRSALDTLSGGLLILDKDERIVLVNKAMAQTVGKSAEDLLGRSAKEMPWRNEKSKSQPAKVPWEESLSQGVARAGDMIGLEDQQHELRTFIVNSSPILGSDGKNRGALVSFEDVTPLEKSKRQLAEMLEKLKDSRDEIRSQNEELKRLATIDPLTNCLNRRSFFEQLDAAWTGALRHRQSLGCIMVDVDHFKSINDNFGHQMGDLVLKQVAATLRATVREEDVVCRYGGEEFCVMTPHLTAEQTEKAAERLRLALVNAEFPCGKVTASLGVSSNQLEAPDPAGMIDQADQCLYVAKRQGRNQVVRFDLARDGELLDSQQEEQQQAEEAPQQTPIPFPAVAALSSALAYRDPATAEHSRRVADLCVGTASGTMSSSELYILEIAALLHDIGKIGVPDAILLKPGRLSRQEWQVMREHDMMGVEMLLATFNNHELAAIVQGHQETFLQSESNILASSSPFVTTATRILSVADAYDSMTSDRIYRPALSRDQAFAELQKCSNTQFDPEIVARFIKYASTARRAVSESAVPAEVALRIGEEVERLALALDGGDLEGVHNLSRRLGAIAEQNGIPQFAEFVGRFEAASKGEVDLEKLTTLAQELMDLCRRVQHQYIRQIHQPAAEKRALFSLLAETFSAECESAGEFPEVALSTRF